MENFVICRKSGQTGRFFLANLAVKFSFFLTAKFARECAKDAKKTSNFSPFTVYLERFPHKAATLRAVFSVLGVFGSLRNSRIRFRPLRTPHHVLCRLHRTPFGRRSERGDNDKIIWSDGFCFRIKEHTLRRARGNTDRMLP